MPSGRILERSSVSICPNRLRSWLHTDLSKALIPVDEIVLGGLPPDGIPAIARPRFVEPGAADAWLLHP